MTRVMHGTVNEDFVKNARVESIKRIHKKRKTKGWDQRKAKKANFSTTQLKR